MFAAFFLALTQLMTLPQGQVRLVPFALDTIFGFPVQGEPRAFFDGARMPVFEYNGQKYILLAADFGKKPGRYVLEIRMASGANYATSVHVTPSKFQTISMNRPYEPEEIPPAILDSLEAERAPMLTTLGQSSESRLWQRLFDYPFSLSEIRGGFGTKRIYTNDTLVHKGVDLRAAYGTAVRAISDGRVLWAEDRVLYLEGKIVVIDHGQGILSLYMHLSEVDVRSGDAVRAGEIIGRVGATGHAYGPHLHLSVRVGGAIVNPLQFIKEFRALENERRDDE